MGLARGNLICVRGSWTWGTVGAMGCPSVSPTDMGLLLFPPPECRQKRGRAPTPDSCTQTAHPSSHTQLDTDRKHSLTQPSGEQEKDRWPSPLPSLLLIRTGICPLVPWGTHSIWATAVFSLLSLSRSSPHCSWHAPGALEFKAHSCCTDLSCSPACVG